MSQRPTLNVEFGAGMAERELDARAVEIKLAGDE